MNIEPNMSIAESFSKYFSVELADTEEQKRQVYSVRYRVYCEEFQYEATDCFPDQLEYDEYDQYSKHCLIRHKQTGRPAGCVRLVPAINIKELTPLPLEKYCMESLDKNLIDNLMLEREQQCEISRLAVDVDFRRRTGETLTRFGEVNGLEFSPQEQRTFSLIAIACFLSATVLTEMENRTSVFAMMEPFLPRMMARSGINFQKVGRDMNYHGVRAPYFITTQSALTNMKADLRELYQ